MLPPSTAPNMIAVKGVMELLAVSKPTIYRLIAKNSFPPPFKIGACCKWFTADVYGWLDDNRGVAEEPPQLKSAKKTRRSKSENIAA